MTENDGYEVAYHNGKERMREEILNKLRDMKGIEMGIRRALVSDIIDAIRKLDVRP